MALKIIARNPVGPIFYNIISESQETFYYVSKIGREEHVGIKYQNDVTFCIDNDNEYRKNGYCLLNSSRELNKLLDVIYILQCRKTL